jgi:single-strand DNA-binding protein
MTTPHHPTSPAADAAMEVLNEVRLRGRLSSAPTVRNLSDGGTLLLFSLVVPRDDPRGQSVDTIDFIVRDEVRERHGMGTWRAGDVVEITGSLRRRFHSFQARSGPATVEVEAHEGRVLVRADGTT